MDYTEEKNNGTLFTQDLCPKLDADFDGTVKRTAGTNLFNYQSSDVLTGMSIKADGVISASSWNTSEKIYAEGDVTRNNVASYNGAWFDKYDNAIVSSVTTDATITKPTDGAYCRISYATTIEATTQLQEGDTFTGYETYVDDARFDNLEKSALNVDKAYPLSSGYYTLETALAVLGDKYKYQGIKISFKISEFVSENWQFVGDSATKANAWKNSALTADNELYFVPDSTKIYTSVVLDANGAFYNLGSVYQTVNMPVSEGDTVYFATRLAYSANAKIVYGFFSDSALGSASLISSSSATTSALTVNSSAVAPAGAVAVGISILNSDTYSYGIKCASFYDKTTQLVKDDKLNTPINLELSKFNFIGGTGILEDDAVELFKGAWFDYDETVIMSTLAYDENSTYNSMNFALLSDLSAVGTIKYDATVDKYELYPVKAVGLIYNVRPIVGYVLMNPSKIQNHSISVEQAYVSFNNTKYKFEQFRNTLSSITQMICVGDSLSAIGIGYTDYVQNARLTFAAFGIGGEDVPQIMARLGISPYMISSDITIPTTTTPVSLPLKSLYTFTAFEASDAGSYSVTVNDGDVDNDIAGTANVVYVGNTLSFSRTVDGPPLYILDSTEIIVDGVTYRVAGSITIPALSSISVDIDVRPLTDNALYPIANLSFNPVTLRGVEGEIEIQNAGTDAYFTRSVAGDAVDLHEGEVMETACASSSLFTNSVLVLWMGQNGGWYTPKELVNQFKAVAKKVPHYIFITPHLQTNDELEMLMTQEFGDNYINMRKWTVMNGLEDSGITPTQADLDAIALGDCPPSLLVDGIHFVASAKDAQANILIKNKLIQKGYL